MQAILNDIIQTLRVQMLSALVMTALFAIGYILGKQSKCENILKTCKRIVMKDSKFKKLCILAFFVSLILLKTLISRQKTTDPLRIVFNDLLIYDLKSGLNLLVAENLILFIPFTILVFWTFGLKNVRLSSIFINSLKISLLFSLFIETSQAVFSLGTFQLSDLLYNTLGGIIGGFVYYFIYNIIDYNSVRKNRLQSNAEYDCT